MNKRVSIVVPVYNSHATLPKCLDSLTAQTYKDLEIICVDDKSADNSVEIIRDYQQKDSRVVLIEHEENKNAGGARNSGINAAKGTYVCFVDNDDWMTPDAIEILIEESEDCTIDLVVPMWCEYFNENYKIDQQNLIVGASKEENCEYALKYGCRILGCLIKRELFYKNNLFYPEKTFFEDNAIATALVFSANNIKPVDKILYYYYSIEGSSSRLINYVKIVDRVKTTRMAYENMQRLGFITDSNQTLVNFLVLRFSVFTVWMLVSEKTKKSFLLFKEVARMITERMPNPYVNELETRLRFTLTHPYFCYFFFGRIIPFIKHYTPNKVYNLFKRIIKRK